MNLWAVFYVNGDWEKFETTEALVRFATGGLIGPVTDRLGIVRVFSVAAIRKIQVTPMQVEPRPGREPLSQ